MGRRTSGQSVGVEKIGNVAAMAGMLVTTQTNQDLTLDPNGTGGVLVNGTITLLNQSNIKLREASGNGTNSIGMQAATSMSSDYTITWPSSSAAANGYVLSSDTSGNLSWINPGGSIAITDPGATSTVYYPFFGTNAGSLPTTLTGLNAKTSLAFVPSTGELTATIGSFANVYGGTGSSNTLTIRGTSNATKATASVLLTDGVASSSTATGTLVVTGGVGISGNCYVGATLTATTITETSSITLKENVSPISNALESVLSLVGVTYDRIDGSSKDEAGLIAEEVYKVLPNMVQLGKNGKPESIKYTKLSAYLIEAIKTLKDEINEIKGK